MLCSLGSEDEVILSWEAMVRIKCQDVCGSFSPPQHMLADPLLGVVHSLDTDCITKQVNKLEMMVNVCDLLFMCHGCW